MTPKPRRAAIYARLSVTAEESVSIARQVEACERYAASRGWAVVHVATDDGVSATKHRPADRPGWASILDSPERFEAVIVWKVDRLARRVLDFLQADEALQARGASLVAVEDPIDLTTPTGRAFATMLAVFGEMEAAAISSRVKGARAHLAREGRAVGVRPWPYESVPNPDGPGVVWRPIPERADAVRDAVRRVVSGDASLRALAREWSDRWPTPRGSATWNPVSLARLLQNPALTGATVHHGELLREPDGTIRRDPARAILTPADHRALLAVLDARRLSGGRVPRDLPLLYDLARCGSCGSRLVQNRRPHRTVYRCHSLTCPARVTMTADVLEAHVVERFLLEAPRRSVDAWIDAPTSSHLADLHEALATVQEALAATEDEDDEARLLARRRDLRSALRDAEAEEHAERVTVPGVDLLDVWHASTTTADRREILASLFERVEVARATSRRPADPAERVRLVTK